MDLGIPRAREHQHLGAEAPKRSHRHQLSTAQRTSEALEAEGSGEPERQSFYSLAKEYPLRPGFCSGLSPAVRRNAQRRRMRIMHKRLGAVPPIVGIRSTPLLGA